MLQRILKFAAAVAFSLAVNNIAYCQSNLDFQYLQIYSSPDGAVQFMVIEVVRDPQWDGNYGPPPSGQPLIAGQTLVASDGATEHRLTFAGNPVNYIADCEGMFGGGCSSWAYILVATQGFADLNLVKPDFIVPNGFLFLPSGSLRLGVGEAHYETLPTDGEHARGDVGIRTQVTGGIVPALPTNNAGEFHSLMHNYTGSWWAAPAGSESGWGINFAHQGDVIFATWATYDADGKPWWLAAQADRTAANVYSGDLFTTTGPPFNAVPFDPAKVVATRVGTATFTFADDNNATFDYIIDASSTTDVVTQSKNITRLLFANPVPTCLWSVLPPVLTNLPVNYQDLWWSAPAGSESGWGLSLTHQGDTIFAVWFTYDAKGSPWWLVFAAKATTSVAFQGEIFTTTGPPFNAVPFDPAKVVATSVGTATLYFTGVGSYFQYNVNGVSETKPIMRQVFAPPGGACL